MHRLPALLAACALSFSLSPAAHAAPAAPVGNLSSNLGSSSNEGVKNAYRSLPREIRDNPQIKQIARDLGIVSPPAPPVAPAPQGPVPAPPQPRPRAGCPNCVALTYDDGPVADTNRLLDILGANRVHASFFLLAPKVNAQPGLVRRMRDSGHTVGNHSVSHPELNKLHPNQVAAEIAGGTNAINAAIGTRPRWFRPPYGATNGSVNAQIGNAGQAVAMWNVDTEDWRTRDTNQTCRTAVDGARPGSIVLMHDIHPATVNAAQCIIDGLRAKGLEPVSLDEMIPNPQAGRVYNQR
ncbi:polysaccharide deacetylase family protein [Corynebacterium phocae]|uniref:polysaccharide deacetylase family protein n=1 Tax=Corynebacterium phocae TaxID=161895 RepID=UPI000951A7C0|nr:polysaccharide deacetylase family protein [Corynebacterium phocae]KAA8720663.1 polysaccharide deacetylase family protein [Corynebacterium phocae]